MSELGIPGLTVDIEKSEISSTLNAVILLAFLMGMYTVIYFGTMYLYFVKNSTNRRLVPATITLLYLTCMVQTGIQWYSTKWEFINNGDTRDSVFMAIFSGPRWFRSAGIILLFIGFVLADGLLIWRCYFVWNRSVRIISLPLFLLIAESGLFLTQIVFITKNNLVASVSNTALINGLLSAAFFTSFGTSIVTTILIVYRVYSVLKQQGTSAKRFKHVLDIVVQSGAVYSLTLFMTAISGNLPGANTLLDTGIFAFQQYAQELLISAAGITTTILVARVALLSPDITFPSSSIHISSLQFNTGSTNQTDSREDTEASQSKNVDGNSVGGGKEVIGKIQ